MVEMTEAAAIVHGATEQSLVLMDEIGRGTSTFDGLGTGRRHRPPAPHDRNRSFTLFATHYFELTDFPAKHERALNVHGRRRRDGRLDRLPARDRGRPGEPQLRRAGGAAGRHAGRAAAAGARHARDPGGGARRPPAAERSVHDSCGRRRRGGLGPIGRCGTAHAASVGIRQRMGAALDPDMLSPRDALDALYRLKALQATPTKDSP